jgi:hypothetical protein
MQSSVSSSPNAYSNSTPEADVTPAKCGCKRLMAVGYRRKDHLDGEAAFGSGGGVESGPVSRCDRGHEGETQSHPGASGRLRGRHLLEWLEQAADFGGRDHRTGDGNCQYRPPLRRGC